MKEKLMKYKKKAIITVVALVVAGLAITGGYIGLGYNYAKKNENGGIPYAICINYFAFIYSSTWMRPFNSNAFRWSDYYRL